MSTKKFHIIRDSVPEDILKIAYRYAIFDEMKNLNSLDPQVPTAYGKYGDSLMESLLIFLKDKISNAINIELIPTYAYYRIYKNGDILRPHKDRESCEITSSLCIGSNYNIDDNPWPLFIDNEPVNLSIGDMVIYNGLEYSHWRNRFDGPKNSIQVQVFFHYVDANGPYKEYKYDTRPGIGFPVSTKKI